MTILQGGGELAEKFKAALAQIGRNIMDPNMDPEAKRGMTINLTFKPSKAGTLAENCDVKTKLAGYAKTETVFMIGQDVNTGRVEISEYGNNRAQVATMQVGAASKEDVIVPNPVLLKPYRTFQEVEQPESHFVFRMNGEEAPKFELVEADNKMWKNDAVIGIKEYFAELLANMPEEIQKRILIIG